MIQLPWKRLLLQLLTIPAANGCPYEGLPRSTSFSADGNTLLDEITKMNCNFAASMTFRVILTDTVVTNIMYYLVSCKIAQFVDRSIGIGMSRPKISKKLPDKEHIKNSVHCDHCENGIKRHNVSSLS